MFHPFKNGLGELQPPIRRITLRNFCKRFGLIGFRHVASIHSKWYTVAQAELHGIGERDPPRVNSSPIAPHERRFRRWTPVKEIQRLDRVSRFESSVLLFHNSVTHGNNRCSLVALCQVFSRGICDLSGCFRDSKRLGACSPLPCPF